MRNLSTEWTRSLKDPQERDDLESLIRNSTRVLGRLQEILTQRLELIDRFENNAEQYEITAWPYRQAHNNGMRAAYTELLRLLEFIDG